MLTCVILLVCHLRDATSRGIYRIILKSELVAVYKIRTQCYAVTEQTPELSVCCT
jgi:hypothetical protein